MRVLLVFAVFLLSGLVASPVAQEVFHWSAQELESAEAQARRAIDPTFHRGIQRLTDSASLIYRDGHSEAEAHTDRADFIMVRNGSATILIGGTIRNGRATTPGEVRGDSVEGAKPYRVSAGDSLYIPINVPHQFLVEPGEYLVTVIVKVVPRSP